MACTTCSQREGDIEVVGESGSALEATRRVPALRPDVAILDARLPDGNGIDVCRDIRSVDPSIKGLILTSYEDDEALFAAIMAGASGYVLKQIRGTDLVDAVRRVAAGQSLLDPAVTQRVLERIRHRREEPRELQSLTEQERRILEYIAEGLTNREIAGEDVPGREDRSRTTCRACSPSSAWSGAPRRRCSPPACSASTTDRHRTHVGQRSTGDRCRAGLGRSRTSNVPPWRSARSRMLTRPPRCGRVAEPAAVVGDRHGDPAVADRPDRHVDGCAPGVAHHIGQRLAQHGQEVGPDLVRHGAVDRAGELQRRAGSPATRRPRPPPPRISVRSVGARPACAARRWPSGCPGSWCPARRRPR